MSAGMTCDGDEWAGRLSWAGAGAGVGEEGLVMTGDGFHIALVAPSRKAVDAFYKAAMKHGGKDNGGSGLNPEYGKNYYAAFVFDPDGYRIEAVINGRV